MELTRSCHQDREERRGVLDSIIDMTRRNDILNYSRTHKFLGDGEFRKG